MKKIILTILALIMLTTPVVSSASFASEPIPDEAILEPEKIVEDIIIRLESVAEQTVANLLRNGVNRTFRAKKIEQLKRKALKDFAAMVVDTTCNGNERRKIW